MRPEPLRLSLVGRTLTAETRSERMRRWLLEHWHFPSPAAPHPFRIDLTETAGSPAPGLFSAAPTVATVPGRTLEVHAAADGWAFGGEDAGVFLRIFEQEAGITVWGAERAERTVFAALFLALTEAMRASGLLPLHASVAAREGRAVAFVGRSGMGKSTTLLRAWRQGWTPLAEDFAWLDPESGRVHGWDRGLHLWPEIRERFGADLTAEPWTTGADGKLFLPFSHLTSEAPSSSLPLARMYVLARGEDGESGSPLTSGETVRAWWEALGVPLSPVTREATAARLPELMRRIPAARLAIGSDPLAL
jgi:hypothetical protein